MKNVWFLILLAPFLPSCSKSATVPPMPIPFNDVEQSVLRQLSERFPNYGFYVDQTDFHHDSTYTVHIAITHQGTKTVYPIKLTKHVDEENPKRIYRGEVPLELFGEEDPHGKTVFTVYLETPEAKQNRR